MRISCNQTNYSVLKQTDKKIAMPSNNTFSSPINNSLSSYPIGYIPSQINFSGNIYKNLPEIIQLKKLPNLPCVYCGKKMVPYSVYDELSFKNNRITRTMKEFVDFVTPTKKSLNIETYKIFEKIQQQASITPNEKVDSMINKISEEFELPNFFTENIYKDITPKDYTKKVIDIISPYEDTLMPVEKEIFKEIKSRTKDGAEKKSLQEIMNELRQSYIGPLSEKQIDIITKIETTANSQLSVNTKSKILNLTNEARKVLKNETEANSFKRKTFIQNLMKIKGSFDESKTLNEINQIAERMPTSNNDLSAFIAKYSNKIVGKNIEAKQRSNEEIAQRLVTPSIASVEHIKTQDSFKQLNTKNKKDGIENLALAHRICNSDRDNTRLEKYVSHNKSIISHVQDYIDFVTKEIKQGNLVGMNFYPLQMKRAYERESRGAIKINLK